MQSAEEFAALLDRAAHTAEGMGERLTDTYRVADLIRARDAEIAEQARAEVLAGLTRQTRPYVDGGPLDGIDGWETRLVTPWEPEP